MHLRRTLILASCSALVLAIAGCVEPSAGHGGGLEAPRPEAPPSAASSIPFRLDVAAGALPTSSVNLEGSNGGTIEVPLGARLLEVASAWECASGPLCLLSLFIHDGDERFFSVEGPSPLQMEIQAPGPGSWTVAMGPAPAGSLVLFAEGRMDVLVS